MKYIIVTGTSRGIGLELVKCFASAGHQVLALSRNIEPVEKLNLPTVSMMAFDLSEESDFDKVKRYVKDHWPRVDVLIHNAGLLINKPFAELTSKDFQTVYNTNVFGVARLSQVVIPFMNKGSHMVTISSMGGIQGSMKFPGLAAYSSSKGAVITLSELLAEEYKASGIAFNVLALGAVQTEMLEAAFPGYKASTNAAAMAKYIAEFALTGQAFYNGKVLQVSATTP